MVIGPIARKRDRRVRDGRGEGVGIGIILNKTESLQTSRSSKEYCSSYVHNNHWRAEEDRVEVNALKGEKEEERISFDEARTTLTLNLLVHCSCVFNIL